MASVNLQNELHSKLEHLLQELATQTVNIEEAASALLKQSITLPAELLTQIEGFITEHKELGYLNKEDFVINAIGFRLDWLKTNNECLQFPREQYETLNEAVKKMGTPFANAEEFINNQINDVLERYEEYRKNKR